MSDLSGVSPPTPPTTLRSLLDGHSMLAWDGQDDGEFALVRCACGWSAGRLGPTDAFATYAEHLQANAVVALALLDDAPEVEWIAGQKSVVIADPRPETGNNT